MEKQSHGHASRDSAIPPRPKGRGFPRSSVIHHPVVNRTFSCRRFLLVGLCLLILPSTAQAFPFIVAGGAITLLPMISLMLVALLTSKRLIALSSLMMIGVSLWISSQSTYVKNVQSDDQNRLAYIMGESRSYLTRAPLQKAPDMKKSLSLEQAKDERDNWVFINEGGMRQQNGIDPYAFLATAGSLNQDAILLSVDRYLSESLASITGHRWVGGGVLGYFFSLGSASDATIELTPECNPSQCARIGVFGVSSYALFSGFHYKILDYSLPIEDFILAQSTTLDHLLKLSQERELLLEFYEVNDDQIIRGVMEWLASHGINNTRATRFVDIEVTKESFSMLTAKFATPLSALDSMDINFLCANGVRLVMATEGLSEPDVLLSGMYKKQCQVQFLPVEGMMPHQVQQAVRELEREPHLRYVGLYSDKQSLFYTIMLLEYLQEEGAKVIGITPIDRSLNVQSMPVQQAVDRVFLNANHLVESIMPWPDAFWAVVAALLLSALGAGFVLAQARWVYLACILGQAMAFVLISFLARYHFPALGNEMLILYGIILFAQCALVMTFKPSHMGKPQSLEALRLLGLKVPAFRVFDVMTLAKAQSIIAQAQGPLIFRSAEKTQENASGASSGLFDSVVARSSSDAIAVMNCWDQMSLVGYPQFIVQDYIEFEQTGTLSTSTSEDGQSLLVFEVSNIGEGITAAIGQYQRTVMSIEQAMLDESPLAQQAVRLWQSQDRHFVAEFGIKQGQPYWLQMMHIADSFIAVRQPHGYQLSEMNQEIAGVESWLIPVLRRCVLGLDYRLFAGQLYERTTRLGALLPLMAGLPLSWLLSISSTIVRRAELASGRHTTLWLTLALVVSQMGVLRSRRDKVVVVSMPDHLTNALAHIGSPYRDSKALHQLNPAYQVENGGSGKPRRLLASVAVREQMRLAITLLMSEYLKQRTQELYPDLQEPLLAPEKGVILPGQRSFSGTSVLTMAELCRLPLHGRGALHSVRLEKPDLDVFTWQARIGRIVLPGPLAMGSHFYQRCRALGIEIVVE